jgi:UPF0271 protein
MAGSPSGRTLGGIAVSMGEGVAPTASLNADIGEGYGVWRIADDAALMALITDANVACGFHAGDPDVMRETCARAARAGVTIGAQVGFHDIVGFGRRFIEMPASSLENDVLSQLGALDAIARAEGTSVRYVTVHGALYHAAMQRPDYAHAVVSAVRAFGRALPMVSQPDTPLATAIAADGVPLIAEGYVDRGYRADGLLVPRGQPGSLIADPEIASRRAVRMVTEGRVESVDGPDCAVAVGTLTIHSDSPGALEMADAVRSALIGAGVRLASVAA